jgi:ComEC/Rec2-related protein
VALPSDPQIVTRPLLSIAAAVIAGAIMAPAKHPMLVAGAASVLAVLTLALGARRRIISTFIAPVPFLLASLAIATARLPPRPSIEGARMIEGVVAEEIEHGGGADGLIIDLTRTASAPGASWVPARGRARIVIPRRAGEALHPAPCARAGEAVQLIAELRAPHRMRMPQLRTRNLAVRRGVSIEGTATSSPACVPRVDQDRRSPVDPPTRGSLALSLAGGDRFGLPRTVEDRVLAAGLGQIFALQGLVIAALVGLVIAALRFACARIPALALGLGRERFSAIGALLALVFLVEAFGATPSVLRAGAIPATLILPRLFGRPFDPWSALSLSAIVVVSADPSSLGDSSFQLAFAGVAAAIRVLARARRAALASLLVLGATVVGTAPLVTRLFERVSLASLAAELAVFPLTGVVLFLAITGATSAADGAARMIEATAAHVSSLGEHALFIPTPSVAECVFFYAAVILMLLPGAKPLARWAGGAIILVIVAVMASWPLVRSLPGELRATFLPVATGIAVVIENPAGETTVFDAGPETAGFDPHEHAVANHLRVLRRTRIDVLVIDDDAIDASASNAAEIARQFTIGRVSHDPIAALAMDRVNFDVESGRVVVPTAEQGVQTFQPSLDGMLTLHIKGRGVQIERFRGGGRVLLDPQEPTD